MHVRCVQIPLSSQPVPPPFVQWGPALPQRPVIVSVPHAGRYYPHHLLSAARASQTTLERLEDRYVDRVARTAIVQGFSIVCATHARAYMDMNRGESDWDSQTVSGGRPNSTVSQRTNAGLGLIPRRLHGVGELWRHRIDHDELLQRVTDVHRPYHAAIHAMLVAAQQRFGCAVLIDLHSMPTQADGVPHIVLGDRYGSTASPLLVDTLIATAQGLGHVVARNAPYAGAHTIEYHADRKRRIEAVQVEIDRALYLDASALPTEQGIASMSKTLLRLLESAEHIALGGAMAAAPKGCDSWRDAAE